MPITARDLSGAHLPFNFALLSTAWNARADRRSSSPSTRRPCRRARGRTGCSAITTGRGSRRASAREQARVAAMLLLTLARHADALLRRRDRHAAGDDRAATACAIPSRRTCRARRRPRRCRTPDAMGRDGACAGFSTRPAVAAAGGRFRDRQRRQARSRPARS